MITTPLSQQRLLLEVKVNLPILTDEILEDLRVAIQIEYKNRDKENPLQERHWCNLSLEEQKQLMKATAVPEVYEDWWKSQKLKRNRRYPKKRELSL